MPVSVIRLLSDKKTVRSGRDSAYRSLSAKGLQGLASQRGGNSRVSLLVRSGLGGLPFSLLSSPKPSSFLSVVSDKREDASTTASWRQEYDEEWRDQLRQLPQQPSACIRSDSSLPQVSSPPGHDWEDGAGNTREECVLGTGQGLGHGDCVFMRRRLPTVSVLQFGPVDYRQYHQVTPIPSLYGPGPRQSGGEHRAPPPPSVSFLRTSRVGRRRAGMTGISAGWPGRGVGRGSSTTRGGRAHWKLADHCSTVLLPAVVTPSPQLPTMLGRFLWLQHQADTKPSEAEVKEVSRCFKGMLSARAQRKKMEGVQLPEGLLQLRWLDAWTRRQVIKKLESFMGTRRVTIVSLENAKMAQHEGARVLRALVAHSMDCLAELHLWCAFRVGQNPLHDTTRLSGGTRGSEFIHILSLLHSLKVLAINYTYLADNTGAALVGLQAVRNGTLEELQLLCLLQETPGRPTLRTETRPRQRHQRRPLPNGSIPRAAWERVRALCPRLAVGVVLMAVGRYEDVNAFLSPPMTVRSLVLSTGVDVCGGEAPCRLPLTLRTVGDWYPATLEELNLNLWRGVEPIDNELISLLQFLPHLKVFEFRGPVYSLESVRRILEDTVNRESCLAYIRMTLQESLNAPPKANFRQEVARLERKYQPLCREKKMLLQLGICQL